MQKKNRSLRDLAGILRKIMELNFCLKILDNVYIILPIDKTSRASDFKVKYKVKLFIFLLEERNVSVLHS